MIESASIDRPELPVEPPRRVDVTALEELDLLLHLPPDEVRVDADATDPSELQERLDEVVVSGVEVEACPLDDVSRLGRIGGRLLDGGDRRDLRERRDRLGRHVDDAALRDVVRDQRPVARLGDRAEVRDDPPLGRLVVVRRDHEEAVDPELVGAAREVNGVAGVVRPRPGDHRRSPAHGLDGGREEGQLLVVRERRRLARRAGHDDAVRAVVDEVAGEALERVEIDRAVRRERRDHGRQDLAEHAVIVARPPDARSCGTDPPVGGTAPAPTGRLRGRP